jgi:hypothetical protein
MLTNAEIAVRVVLLIALIVLGLDLFYWRAG